jgi:phage terminase large subunit-like protein
MIEPTRSFIVEKPIFTEEDFAQLPYSDSARHLELYYNIIMSSDNMSLPDHLRPAVWALADPGIDKAMVIISPGSGKSQLVDVVYPTWRLGLAPTTTILGVSSAEGLMTTFIQAAMNIIENNNIYKEVFPNVRPDKDTGWSAGRGIFVTRGLSSLAPPSYSVSGYKSRSIIGKHARELLVDDIHDEDNSANTENISDVEGWYYRTLIGRQDPEGSRFFMTGRRWAEDDLYARLRKSGDWLVMELAAFVEGTDLYYKTRIPAGMSCCFNNYTPSEKVEDIRIIYGTNPSGFYWIANKAKFKEANEAKRNRPDIYETVYQCQPEHASTVIFRKEDFRTYAHPDTLDEGRSEESVSMLCQGFDEIIQTWDTAYTSNKYSNNSVCYSIGLRYCNEWHRGNLDEEIPPHYDCYVLDEVCLMLDYAELVEHAVYNYNKWQPNQVLIEKAAVGHPLVAQLTQYNIPILGIVPQGTNKRSRAINGAKAGSAQGWFRQGRVLFPEHATWRDAAETELCSFTGTKNEKDDRVDALIQGINYAIDAGIHQKELPPEWRWGGKNNNRTTQGSRYLPKHPLDMLFAASRSPINPFTKVCGSCTYFEPTSFCAYHNRPVSALHSCPVFTDKGQRRNPIIYLNR